MTPILSRAIRLAAAVFAPIVIMLFVLLMISFEDTMPVMGMMDDNVPLDEVLEQTLDPPKQPTPVYSDTLTSDGRLVPVASTTEPTRALAYPDSLGPARATVTLTLRNLGGTPATNACVQAYSEDWKVVLPRRMERTCANASGTLTMALPLGAWSFFASGPSYFAPLLNRSISGTTSLTIQPASTITIEVRDFGGAPLNDVEVYLIESQRKPLLAPASTGTTSSENLLVAVTPGLSYDVLLIRRPPVGTSNGTAFFVHAGVVTAGSTLHYQMQSSQLALLRFNLTNSQGITGARSSLMVKYPNYSLDLDGWFWRDTAIHWDQLQLWLSPEPIIVKAAEFADNWIFDFGADALTLQAGMSHDYLVGGALDVHTWFYPLLDDGRQIWIQARDTSGHTLVYYTRPDGTADIPITLRDGDGNVVYTGTFQHGHELSNLLPQNPQGLQYEVNLDLGFLGTYTMTGQALDPGSTWALETITTTHFVIHWPLQLHTQIPTITLLAEQSYSATAATLGHLTESWLGHGRIEFHVPFYCDCAGWTGGSTFAVVINNLMHGDALSSVWLGDFKIVWAHELVHVFQGTGAGLSNYGVASWFGEPFASFAGWLSMEDIYGGSKGSYWVIRDLEELFFWLLDQPDRRDGDAAYIMNFVRRLYTMQAHRDWIQFWAGSGFPNRACFGSLGLTDVEGLAVSYSYVVNANLGWLFREARLDISDARIQQGRNAISSCIPPAFSNVTIAANISDAGGSHGAAWGDYDGDGYQDLYVTFFNGTDILYHNNGNGTFADATASAGFAGLQHGRTPIWGDYDNDGDVDLYVTRDPSPADLWRNNGNGTFTNVTAAAGVSITGQILMSAAWGDYDRDGSLDILVARWCNRPLLYHNNGNGTFNEMSSAAGITHTGCGIGATFGDYDGDGNPDIYLTFLGSNNALYQNNGNGTFTDVTVSAGVSGNTKGEGPTWGDYDNDGDLDLFVASDAGYPNLLYRNNGNGTFTDVAITAGITITGTGRGAAWGDYNNDGWLDLALLNWGSLVLYRNNGNGTFSEATSSEGLDSSLSGNGLAWGDYDSDGQLDLYLTSVGGANRLYHNQLDGNWLTVKTIGTQSNRAGIGARLQLTAGGPTQIREVSGGSGFHSQDSLPVEFGLGMYTGTVTVTVRWPSGIVQTQTGINANRIMTITEQSTPPAGIINPALYFPLEVGNRWVYSWTNNVYAPTPIVETLVVSAQVDNEFEISARHKTAFGTFGIVTDTGYLWTYNDTQGQNPFPLPKYMLLHYLEVPNNLFPASFSVGDTWTGTAGYVGNWYTGTTTVITNTATVSVSGHIYTDCLQIRTVITDSHPFGAGTRDAWFAPNVGLVKFTYNHNDGSITTAELQMGPHVKTLLLPLIGKNFIVDP